MRFLWRITQHTMEVCIKNIPKSGVGQDITAPYAEHKLQKKWVEQIFDPRKERGRLERYQDCASHLIFHHCKDKSHFNRLHAANFCRDRMCIMCQWRKSLRTYANISKAVDHILATNKQNPQFILLTLTVKNCEVADTGSTIKRMSEAFQRFRRKKFFTDQIRGYFRTLEVSFNEKSNSMHPHYHVLLHVDKSYFKGSNYIKRDRWLDEWRKAYKDFNITQVDIRNLEQKTPEALRKSVCEVAKYAVKPNVMTQTGNVELKLNALKALKEHLKGVHLQQAGGSLWFALKASGAVLEDDYENLSDDLVDGVDCPVCMEELIRSWYKWMGKEYQLKRTASLGYIWSRDYKIICDDHKIYDGGLIEEFNQDIPYGKNVPGYEYSRKAGHKAEFQRQGDVSQRKRKRSVGRSEDPTADPQGSLFPRPTITKKIRLPSSPGKSSITFSVD